MYGNNKEYSDLRYKIMSILPLLEAMENSSKNTKDSIVFDDIVQISRKDFSEMLDVFKRIEKSETPIKIDPFKSIPFELPFTNWVFYELQKAITDFNKITK